MLCLLQKLLIVISITGIFAGEFCTICSGTVYCDSGCCSTQGSPHCCPNTTAIVVGSVFGTLIVIIILSSVFVCYMQYRRNRLIAMNKYIAVQTQYEEDDFTNLSGKSTMPGIMKGPVSRPRPPPTDIFAGV